LSSPGLTLTIWRNLLINYYFFKSIFYSFELIQINFEKFYYFLKKHWNVKIILIVLARPVTDDLEEFVDANSTLTVLVQNRSVDFRCTPTELYSNNSAQSERLERGFNTQGQTSFFFFRIFFSLFHSFSPFSPFIAAIFVCVCVGLLHSGASWGCKEVAGGVRWGGGL
jgi:hypothetical protein